MKFLIPVALLGLLFSCQIEKSTEDLSKITQEAPEEKIIVEKVEIDSSIHFALAEFGLVDITTVDSTIQFDLKYATEDNFMGHILYDTLNRLFVQKDVAEKLKLCQTYLKDTMPNYSLLIYDGVRPLQVQREMWNALDSIPTSRRGKFVSNPAFGSVHNFGAAVDITICDENGTPIDMGAGYDDFNEIAFPSLEWKFLKSGELSKEQWQNRKLLREVMKSQGFRNIPSEWWHFNVCSREDAIRKYPKLIHESGK